jgi:hypothetical protein
VNGKNVYARAIRDHARGKKCLASAKKLIASVKDVYAIGKNVYARVKKFIARVKNDRTIGKKECADETDVVDNRRMFESLQADEAEDARRAGAVRRGVFVAPAAFSAACLAAFLLFLKLDAKGLAEGIALLWKLGLPALTILLSLLAVQNGRIQLALAVWLYSVLVAGVTLALGLVLLVTLVGAH